MAAGKKSSLKKKTATKKKTAATGSGKPKKAGTRNKAAARRPAAKKKTAARRPAAKKKASSRRRAPAAKAPGILQRIVDVFKPTASTPLNIDTESLPQFTVGQAKKVSIQASGGKPPYKFSLTQGTLPAGLKFNPLGTLSGTARSASDSTIWIQVSDAARPPGRQTQAFDLRVA